jgi:signal transduction histidine kinase
MAVLPGPTNNDRLTGEQAALRRVATLVARGAPPEEVFAAVTGEAGRLLGAYYATMARYDPDRARTIVATWSSTGRLPYPVGTQTRLGGRNVTTLVFQRGRATRIDDITDTSGPVAEVSRKTGILATVGVPIRVEGGLWGVMTVESGLGPLPPGTEEQLAGFTELAATAIANAQARVELRGFADEQAALRRVATLVAQGASPEKVLTAVTEEAGRLLGADLAIMSRYDPDGLRTVVASWGGTGAAFPIGNRIRLGGRNVPTLIFQTRQAARIDYHDDASGPIADAVRAFGLRASVGVPVSVEGRLWGLMAVGSRTEPPPAGTEAQLARFTELAATAIANAQARVELRGFAEEQAALRRVATLVAHAAPPAEVLTAVTEEAGRLLHADHATMKRYDPDDTVTVVAAWGGIRSADLIGAHARLGGRNVPTLIFQTHRPARIDDYTNASGPISGLAGEFGLRGAVGVPVSAEGRLWGAIFVGSRAGPLPAGTEERLARFTELAGTAIANAHAQDALTASRARIVATADATRRRIERNLHDGAQQRLVSLALNLRAAEAAAAAGDLQQQLDQIATGMRDVLEELREIARGLHPAILADGGLAPALKTLARRAAIPVQLDVQVDRRLPDPVETAAYYTVSEALTNAAKHARATTAQIEVTANEGVLRLRVCDNGRGGADFTHGTGLLGLKDRAEALGGHLDLRSPPGAGTTLDITLPINDPTEPELPP